MEKAINANKLHHHWPIWLGDKVNNYLAQGLSSTQIINKFLNERNIIIRQSGIYKRRQKMANKDMIVLGIESTAQEKIC